MMPQALMQMKITNMETNDMVEWKKLGEVISVHTGSQLNRNDMPEQGVYPVINGGRTPSGYTNEPNEKSNSITISQGGESAGFVNWMDCDFWAGAHCYVVECLDDTIKRYVFHFLKNSEYELMSSKQGAGIPGLNRKNLYKLVIPVPSISEQTRIVGILDTFTASIDNLKQQIALRRKQYEHYRDQLLDLEGKEGVVMKTLGEVGTFIRGSGIQKNDFVDEGFGCIHYGQIHTKFGLSATETVSKISDSLYKKSKKAVKGDVVLATTSEDAEGVAKPVAWLGDESIAVSGDAYIFHHDQNGKFMAYQFASHRFRLFKIAHATGAKVVRISGDSMAKFAFPLPSIDEQQRIVSILDTFEASIANLEEQLKEREMQYEYYRNKLLTF